MTAKDYHELLDEADAFVERMKIEVAKAFILLTRKQPVADLTDRLADFVAFGERMKESLTLQMARTVKVCGWLRKAGDDVALAALLQFHDKLDRLRATVSDVQLYATKLIAERNEDAVVRIVRLSEVDRNNFAAYRKATEKELDTRGAYLRALQERDRKRARSY